MSKWYYQKRKKAKAIPRPASVMTGKPRLTPPITKLTLIDEPFEKKRYTFARQCYLYDKKRVESESGNTWFQIFELREGVSLGDYIKFAKENKLGEKYGL